jgi:hypothetical protein
MSITISTGTQVFIASTYGVSKNMTAITNVSEAVATLESSHGVVQGDFLEVTSGWDLLTGRIVRAKTVSTNDITFESINTVGANFPAGTGIGTIRRITAWTAITQIKDVGTSGGDLQFADATTIVDRIQKQIPTTRSPIQLDFTVFDDPALAWYAIVQAAADSATATGIQLVFPTQSKLVGNGFYSIQTTPTITSNTPLSHKVGFSAVSNNVRYAT